MTRNIVKTVVVLGVSYGGSRAARLLATSLPPGWRVVAIDRNSHLNHLYTFPRFTILPQHAAKGFIPYDNLFNPPAPSKTSPADSLPTPPLTPHASLEKLSEKENPHLFIQGNVVSLHPHHLILKRPGVDTPERIDFDYAVYALGGGMPDPVNVWSSGARGKRAGMKWMAAQAEQYKLAKRILVVGGGALGIQYASDLKEVYPEKEITLLHSRERLLPIYPIEMHLAVIAGLHKLGVNVVLGERVMSWPENPQIVDGHTKKLHTDKGREFEADLVLVCTGSKPHSALMATLSPTSISPTTQRILVRPTLQVAHGPSLSQTIESLSALNVNQSPPSPAISTTSLSSADADEHDLSHIFAIGDCAETGEIQAGRSAWLQAATAASNIVKLIGKRKDLEDHVVAAPAIKVSLGLKHLALSGPAGTKTSDDGAEDVGALGLWPLTQAETLDVNT
ncbi:apoptosis-inducing factor 2, partial [Tremellales sp. Uapishka_1]